MLLDAHWSRFEAWCSAWGRSALPASPETIDEFLELFPGSRSQQRLRRQAIARAHAAAGESSPVTPAATPTVWHEDPKLADVERALAEIPKYRHPVGLRGRRDAFLIVLTGYLRLSRSQARSVSVDDIELTSILKIRGRVIPIGNKPVTCMACAVTRWLRVVGNSYRGHRRETYQLLDPTRADLEDHDCHVEVEEDWRVADQLLLPLDAHGWARPGVPLSKGAITRVLPARRRASGFVEMVGPRTRRATRFNKLTVAETYKAAGELEEKVAAAAARAAEAVAQARRLGLDIDGLLVPVPDEEDDNEGPGDASLAAGLARPVGVNGCCPNRGSSLERSPGSSSHFELRPKTGRTSPTASSVAV
ncbi:hypothetical protein [Frondihabitans cladoniiphilus]